MPFLLYFLLGSSAWFAGSLSAEKEKMNYAFSFFFFMNRFFLIFSSCMLSDCCIVVNVSVLSIHGRSWKEGLKRSMFSFFL